MTISPGTKWCGSGDVAKNNQDIGYFYMTDNCCREHDLCEHIIEPASESFGLRNSGKFTRLHCDCDEKFFKCLKYVNTLVSKQIGILYFNVLGHQCFKEDFPVIACAASLKGRCVKWKKNVNATKSFQWFDNKWF
jgi:secretory phospholipase A2